MNKNKVAGAGIAVMIVGVVLYFGFNPTPNPSTPTASKIDAQAATTMAYRPTELGPHTAGAASLNSTPTPAILTESQERPTTTQAEDPSSNWEPIGKYSQKEIAAASIFIGSMFAHLKRMDAIEASVTKALRAGYRNVDANAVYRSITGYGIDAIEEMEKIDALEVPELENQQAEQSMRGALLSLQASSKMQNERASILAEFLQQNPDAEKIGVKLKEVEVRRGVATIGMVKSFGAYLSYGFTSRAIDEKTYRLKPHAKPDRETEKS